MPDAADADPVATRSGLAFGAFGWYLRWYLFRKFHAVRLSLTGLPAAVEGRPVIVYGNHPSWWDPALYIMMATWLFPGRPGYGPMDAKALGDYGVFERMGVFGVALDSPGAAARFLKTSIHVLSDPASMLWITAEGEFTDPRRRPLRLRPGIAHLARRVPGAIILPLALEYTFWDESRPEVLARFGAPVETGAQHSVAEWTAILQDALGATMDGLAAEAMQRDPALFQTLLRGGAGVGGVYDLYRRSRARLAGRPFDPRHGAQD